MDLGTGVKRVQTGLTLVETVVVALLIVLVFATVIMLFRGGSGNDEVLARTSALETGWQRFITAIHDDIRSATAAELADEKLKISCAKIDHDSSNLATSDVEYFLASDGYFWRQDTGNTRKFAFTSQQRNLAASLTFSVVASNSVLINLTVLDTRTSNRIFDRNEVVTIAGQ